MKYKKRISIGQFFKKGTDICDGDTLTIANEGKQVEGQFGTQDIFLVKKGEDEGNVSFNTTSINNLIDGYGEDSISWIGKEIKVQVIKMSVQGKIKPVYFFLHPDSVLDDETGEFHIPGKRVNDEEIPVIEEDDENEAAQLAAGEDKIDHDDN
uniref:Uncharacterized protein n=1 Tax=viral metagenome TaxID=1070528 RepID=A0A6H2A3L9_9ZZZZ